MIVLKKIGLGLSDFLLRVCVFNVEVFICFLDLILSKFMFLHCMQIYKEFN